MSDSILSNERRCFFCGETMNLHRHHIYGGTANRKISEKHGCWVYLCAKHHNMSNQSVHNDREMDLALKQICQKKMEKEITRDEFIRIFGKSFL